MSKILFIALVTLGSLVCLPGTSFACGTSNPKSEHSCCKNENSDKKNCCGDSQKDDENKECNGECGNSSCHCPTILLNFISPPSTQYLVVYSQSVDEKFYYQEGHYPSSPCSIWLPPKIG